MFAHILRDQLGITADEFWMCVRHGDIPDRSADETIENGRESIPVDVASLLINRVGLTQRDLIGMTREQAIARLNEYWSGGT
jgi:hypothetical protein